jgi:hypothetical protein
MYRAALLVLFSILASAGVAEAQAVPAVPAGVERLREGDVVRLKTASTIGEFLVVSASDFAVVVRSGPAGSPFEVPFTSIQSLDRNVGLRSRGEAALGTGAVGLVVGAVGGATLGFMSGDDPPGTFLAFSAGDKALMLGSMFGVAGGVLGAAAGAISPGQKWERLILQPTLHVGPMRDGRVEIGVSRAF